MAQAFHWFDTPRALSELHRVLVPDGRLVLAWNKRDESVPWVRRLGEVIERITGGEAPSQHHGLAGAARAVRAVRARPRPSRWRTSTGWTGRPSSIG